MHNKRIHLQGLHSRPGSLALGLVHRKIAFGHHHNCQTVPLSSNFSISGAEKKKENQTKLDMWFAQQMEESNKLKSDPDTERAGESTAAEAGGEVPSHRVPR